jgi:hypothetical protein
MSNNFNISEWRRQQLQKEVIKEDLTRILENEEEADMKKYRKEVLQQLLSWYKKQDEPDQNMVKKLEKEIGGINENINNSEFAYGTYSKDEVELIVGPGGQVRWFNKVVTVDELPDQVQFTKVISGIPTFINAGGYKTPGDSMVGFDPKEEERYAVKRRINRNV